MTSNHVEIMLVKNFKVVIISSLELILLPYDSVERAEQE